MAQQHPLKFINKDLRSIDPQGKLQLHTYIKNDVICKVFNRWKCLINSV